MFKTHDFKSYSREEIEALGPVENYLERAYKDIAAKRINFLENALITGESMVEFKWSITSGTQIIEHATEHYKL